MSKKEEIIHIMQSMIGRYSYYEVYNDWVKLCALVMQNNITYKHDEVWKTRENQYIDTIKKYSKDEQKKLIKMFYLLWDAFEENMSDILGEIYMESGCSNKNTGQFFTPFHISYLTAQTAVPMDICEDNKLIMNEPSTGGGGIIIAAAKVLKERGLNYQKCMRVTAQDLDWHGVYMTYVQMCVLGIKGIVLQGSSISKENIADYPEERIFRTPAKMGAIW